MSLLLSIKRRQLSVTALGVVGVVVATTALMFSGPPSWRRLRAWLRLKLLPWRGDSLSQCVGQKLPFANPTFSLESIVKAMEYCARPSDVFILTPPKTGTTWLQMICHALRTSGNHMDFEDIYQVIPWDQLAWDLGQRLDEEQVAKPRIFKTHLPLSQINRHAKYLCVVREPEPTLLSWYNFLLEKEVPPVVDCGSPSTFVLERPGFVGDGMRYGSNLWGYYAEFVACLALPNVLVLAYEDLVANLDGHLDIIADFLDVALPDADARSRAIALSSREGMMRHVPKFDGSWTYAELQRIGRAPDKASSFRPAPRVKAVPSTKQSLNESAQAFLEQKWANEIFAKTGLKDYSELRGRVTAEIERRQSQLQMKKQVGAP